MVYVFVFNKGLFFCVCGFFGGWDGEGGLVGGCLSVRAGRVEYLGCSHITQCWPSEFTLTDQGIKSGDGRCCVDWKISLAVERFSACLLKCTSPASSFVGGCLYWL